MTTSAKLPRHVVASEAWALLAAELQRRLDGHRRKNDGALDPTETARLRGRIAECKAILNLAEEDVPSTEA